VYNMRETQLLSSARVAVMVMRYYSSAGASADE
jgi:hypothetical protein